MVTTTRRTRRGARWILAGAIAVGALGSGSATAQDDTDASGASSDAQALAERYAPVMMLKAQEHDVRHRR